MNQKRLTNREEIIAASQEALAAWRAGKLDEAKRMAETIRKAVRDLISITHEAESAGKKLTMDPESMNAKDLKALIARVKKQMERAAANLDFETAAQLRDRMLDLRKYLD